jgi:hypothetical protein
MASRSDASLDCRGDAAILVVLKDAAILAVRQRGLQLGNCFVRAAVVDKQKFKLVTARQCPLDFFKRG